ncbi:hypothetical protein [Sharpea azabuensis]|uniref:hypothetical protein n=1 Tax=Sharpea azabuensis TaxID=322505 RepID=UPI00240952FD|nr:hypothetical protein [Sharpea azabuensis]MDD6512812.1 hypothetical protein [Sharpea azabuensis]
MNKMNNKKEKTMFSVENCDDGSGLAIKAHGNQAAVGMMVAIGLIEYFGQDNAKISMDEFINVLKKAYEDSDFFKLMVSAASLYAKDEKDGLKAFAVLTAVANVKRMTDGKDKEVDEKGGPVA